MATELQALLALQEDDVVITGLEERLAALEPRIRDLDARQTRIVEAMTRSTAAVQVEEQKQAHLRDRIGEHRQLIEKNKAAMDVVQNIKQATAAAAQMEQAMKIVAVEESELLIINRRLEELRGAVAGQKTELATLATEQEAARAEVAAEQAVIDGEMAAVREKREAASKAVPSALLYKYDRIRVRKRTEAVFAMRGMSCGNCDTAIPMQRRHVMTSTEAIDLCEACGVLMYFTPA